MSKYFERQLEELHVQLITLGSYCEKAISFSAKAIQKVQNEEIALKSDEIKDFINEKYDGAVIPFDDSADTEDCLLYTSDAADE